jgi:prepilin signal peptidase PulO-like enzyme (type II secretory pathway)
MSPLVAFAGLAGAGYAGGLWLLARNVAARRALALGSLPVWLMPLAALLAAIGAGALAPPLALVVASTVIGACVCAIVDARLGLIFDALCGTMVVVAGCETSALRCVGQGLVALALVGGLLLTLHLLTGRRGIGLGDVKLGSAIALGYGPGAAIVAIGGAFVLGASYALAMLAMGRARRSDTIAFGPFMAGGALVGAAAAAGWIW